MYYWYSIIRPASSHIQNSMAPYWSWSSCTLFNSWPKAQPSQRQAHLLWIMSWNAPFHTIIRPSVHHFDVAPNVAAYPWTQRNDSQRRFCFLIFEPRCGPPKFLTNTWYVNAHHNKKRGVTWRNSGNQSPILSKHHTLKLPASDKGNWFARSPLLIVIIIPGRIDRIIMMIMLFSTYFEISHTNH